jgi:hypothetical protein
MVTFGIRSRDKSYAGHAGMMREKFGREGLQPTPGRIDQVGADLWVVSFTITGANILGIVNGLLLMSFGALWVFLGFRWWALILPGLLTLGLVFKNRLWYFIYWLAARRKYGAKMMRYVDAEEVVSEVMIQWDKQKSTSG